MATKKRWSWLTIAAPSRPFLERACLGGSCPDTKWYWHNGDWFARGFMSECLETKALIST